MPASTATRSRGPLGERERQFASLIWRRGRMGRREIHQFTGVHPTLTGNAVSNLLAAKLLRDAEAAPTADRGRPQVPLEIDPQHRSFLGVSISPGAVRVAEVNALGQVKGEETTRPVSKPARIVEAAAKLLAERIKPAVISIGVSFTGLVDPQAREILFSSSLLSEHAVSLAPLYDAAGKTPIVLQNDMHALAVRWLMTNGSPVDNVLLVGIGDGSLGASVLLDGRPHRGSVSAGNELGHMRLNVETDRCFCGAIGCLERIVSTKQLPRFGSKSGRSLDEALADVGQDRAAVDQVLNHLATGISNAINFIRPDKVVVTSPLVRHGAFTDAMRDLLPPRILPGLRERVEMNLWYQPVLQSAENAAWLALADIFGRPVSEANKANA